MQFFLDYQNFNYPMQWIGLLLTEKSAADFMNRAIELGGKLWAS